MGGRFTGEGDNMGKRRLDWETRLNDHIRYSGLQKLDYVNFDCCIFICGAVEALTGYNPYPDFPYPYKGKREALKAIRQYCIDNKVKEYSIRPIVQIMGTEAGGEIVEGFPMRGDIITIESGGQVLGGVCIGDRAVVITEKSGLRPVRIEQLIILDILRFT